MDRSRRSGGPQWRWKKGGGGELFGSDGVEYSFTDGLARVEVERLLGLNDLDAVEVSCGAGIRTWVDATQSRQLWDRVKDDLDDVEDWVPPARARGTQPYRAELWRSKEGRHVLLFTNE